MLISLSPILALVALSGALGFDPPLKELYDSGGVLCLKLAENGVVADAFMGKSTGSKRTDKAFLAWGKLQKWPEKKHEGEIRGEWFAMTLMTSADKPFEKIDCTALAPRP